MVVHTHGPPPGYAMWSAAPTLPHRLSHQSPLIEALQRSSPRRTLTPSFTHHSSTRLDSLSLGLLLRTRENKRSPSVDAMAGCHGWCSNCSPSPPPTSSPVPIRFPPLGPPVKGPLCGKPSDYIYIFIIAFLHFGFPVKEPFCGTQHPSSSLSSTRRLFAFGGTQHLILLSACQ